jgi:hypothetical protein
MTKAIAQAVVAQAESVVIKKAMVEVVLEKQRLAFENRQLLVREKEAEAAIHAGRAAEIRLREAEAVHLLADAQARFSEALNRFVLLEQGALRLEVRRLRAAAGFDDDDEPTKEELARAYASADAAQQAWVSAGVKVRVQRVNLGLDHGDPMDVVVE